MIDSDLYKTVLRGQWDERDVDQKAVGGHLQLMKRLSTPLSDACGPSATAMSQQNTSLLLPHNTNALQQVMLVNLDLNANNQHRKLDRSLSEPVKAQLQPQTQGQPTQGNSTRYKTELCRPFEENNFCKYGEKCQFAHGRSELRTMTRHPKYKTILCRTFHTAGFCPYGARCHFIHNDSERKNMSFPHHAPLTATTSLTSNFNFQNISSYLGSTADSPSPPSSHHGSPTLFNSSFFDDAFYRNSNLIMENLTNGSNNSYKSNSSLPSPTGISIANALLKNSNQLVDYDIFRDNGSAFPCYDTPPISPVESLAGDVDNLSLSSAPSDSPVPPNSNNILNEINRNNSRLPIFEKLSEDKAQQHLALA